MVASWDSMKAVYDVMKKHVTDGQMHKILQDLSDIDGNKSFRDSIRRLVRHHDHTK